MSAENPVLIEIPANVWTEVSESIRTGFVHIMKADSVYYQTHRILPEVDPPDPLLTPDDIYESGKPLDEIFEGVAIYYRTDRIAGKVAIVGGTAIRSTVDRKIYIYSDGAAGLIRLDEGA